MDRSQIINLLVNAVITIITTAVVVRLSLNKGKLGITSKVKARVTPKVKAYVRLILSVLLLIIVSINLYRDVSKPGLPTRTDVLVIILSTASVGIWIGMVISKWSQIAALREQETARSTSDEPRPK
jgi:hypothetical protein